MGITYEMSVSSSRKEEILDITSQVRELVKRSGIRDGICVVHAMHTTAGILVNENYDPSLKEDILDFLNRISKGQWKHDKEDNNASAHLKSMIIGQSQSISVKNGSLMLGTWQGICLAEFDGPKLRKIAVSIV
jgi:secondary thiamine-phosphate synthase enzyme